MVPAKPYVDNLLEAGIVDQDVDKSYLEIDTPMSYSEPDRGVDLVVTPSDDLRITFMIDYQKPGAGDAVHDSAGSGQRSLSRNSRRRGHFASCPKSSSFKPAGLIKGGGLRQRGCHL